MSAGCLLPGSGSRKTTFFLFNGSLMLTLSRIKPWLPGLARNWISTWSRKMNPTPGRMPCTTATPARISTPLSIRAISLTGKAGKGSQAGSSTSRMMKRQNPSVNQRENRTRRMNGKTDRNSMDADCEYFIAADFCRLGYREIWRHRNGFHSASYAFPLRGHLLTSSHQHSCIISIIFNPYKTHARLY